MSLEFTLPIARGHVDRFSHNHKFGRNASVGTSFTPICNGGIYRTPQVSGATQLRVKAGNVNDTALGSGARQVTLVGLDTSGNEITETLATAGASASAPTSQSFLRLYRYWVSDSGTYATQSAGSHAADIVIENAAGTQDWATISATSFPRGQSQIGAVSIPTGYDAFIIEVELTIASNKSVDVMFFRRDNILDTAAGYDAMRVITEQDGLTGPHTYPLRIPLGPYHGPCDIGALARADSASAVSIDFDVLLIQL